LSTGLMSTRESVGSTALSASGFRAWLSLTAVLILILAGCGSDDFPEKSQLAIDELEVEMRQLAADLDMELVELTSYPALQEYEPSFVGTYVPPTPGRVELRLELVSGGENVRAGSGPAYVQDLVDRLADAGYRVVTQACLKSLQRAGFENAAGDGLDIYFRGKSPPVRVAAFVDPEHNRVGADRFAFVPDDVEGDCWPEPS